MKKFIYILISLILITAFITTLLKICRPYFDGVSSKKDTKLVDSIRILNSEITYYSSLISFENKYEGYPFDKSTKVYLNESDDRNPSKTPENLDSLFKRLPYHLILRYTEIGCDLCSDLTIQKLKNFSKSHPTLPIFIFVDFTNYDAYLQWRKLSAIKFNIYFVKKEKIRMDYDCQNYSYIFMVDKYSKISKCFIPNYSLPKLLDEYLESIKIN